MNWSLVADESENRTSAPANGRTYRFPRTNLRYVAVRLNYTSAGKGLPLSIAEIKVK
jgi:hypothetical protein